ncbi:MAG: hypothetical protein OXC81_05005 [Betaproteobacteria bacterium]|nr:hypothetical protein [Betaproteobacteria bacterium]
MKPANQSNKPEHPGRIEDRPNRPMHIYSGPGSFYIKADDLVNNHSAVRQIQELRDFLSRKFYGNGKNTG